MKNTIFKRITMLALAIVMLISIVPLNAFAWDEYIECEFCGEGCGDDYICSCGEHCSEESGRSCYEEHHCKECGGAADDLCDNCGKCYDCGGKCSAGDDGCLKCHLKEGMACADCGQCWYDYDTICSSCLGCKVCIGYCSTGDEDHQFCIDCHADDELCPVCDECYIVSDIYRCDSCYTCFDCVYICPECNLCENCVEICEKCEDICIECHEANGEACSDCGFCYFGEIYCQDCGICYDCEYICPDCELCLDCDDDYHCVECDECFEVNGQCETGGAHCAVCLACDSEIDFCQDCGVCEDCCLCGVTSGITGKVEGIKKNESVEIMLFPFGEEEPILKKTATAEDAEYSFENVPAGKYRLRIAKNGETIYEENVIIGKETANHNPDISPEAPEYLLGDANCDGAIDQYDYILVKRHYFGTRILTESEMLPADANEDGKIDQYDYILIKRHYFGTFVIGG